MTLVNAETGEIVPSLVELEEAIERDLDAFLRVGNALATIRDNRLHHAAGYTNFDSYCRERWGMSRQRSSQLIAAARTMGELAESVATTVATPAPTSERQVRPLTKLPTPEAKREAWRAAAKAADVEKRQPTAADVERAVERQTLAETVGADRMDEVADIERPAYAGAKVRDDVGAVVHVQLSFGDLTTEQAAEWIEQQTASRDTLSRKITWARECFEIAVECGFTTMAPAIAEHERRAA